MRLYCIQCTIYNISPSQFPAPPACSPEAKSSFRWFTKRYGTLCTTVQWSQFWSCSNFWLCCLFSFIGNLTVTIDARPMRLVHFVLYQLCTAACIACASILVTVVSPIKTKDYSHVFFSVTVQFYYSLHKIWSKNLLMDRHLLQQHQFWTT